MLAREGEEVRIYSFPHPFLTSHPILFLQDYIFSILTGYCDPPAGVEVPEEMAYNPYFPGGAISMPQQLYPDSVEYDDGEWVE